MSLRVFVLVAAVTTLLAGCGGRVVDLVPVAMAPAPPAEAEQQSSAYPHFRPAHYAEAAPIPMSVGSGDGPYLLDTGDKLRIFVYGQPNLSRLYTVDQSGMISFPLVGSIRARGITTSALEKAIARKLSSDYVKDPQVTVDINQNRPFFILGEVRSAGQYPWVSGLTVEAAVAIAGGYLERASEERFRITRRKNGLVEVMEVPPDFPVQPGDTVYVRERFF